MNGGVTVWSRPRNGAKPQKLKTVYPARHRKALYLNHGVNLGVPAQIYMRNNVIRYRPWPNDMPRCMRGVAPVQPEAAVPAMRRRGFAHYLTRHLLGRSQESTP